MSKTFRSILLIFTSALLILQFSDNVQAHDVAIKLAVDAARPNFARIEGRIANDKAALPFLSFMRTYAGISGLDSRISELRLAGPDGDVTFKRIASGEYVGERSFYNFSYLVDLTPSKRADAAAHVSWLGPGGGMLALDDLLPQPTPHVSFHLTLDLPAGWRMLTTENRSWENVIEGPDARRCVIFVGRGWRVSSAVTNKVSLAISGEWHFTDAEMEQLVSEIYAEYSRIFGKPPEAQMQIAIMKPPQNASTGIWEAETRGSTITIVSSDTPFKSQSIQRLHEQLRHEIFHFWIPNGVSLTGNYDWFYEGFALYRSLKLGVAVNRIRFDDLLDTLSRAYDIDRLSGKRSSLVDASNNRWSGSSTQIYARGMLVAFMCDVAMLDASKGKRSTDELLRELYENHRPPSQSADANLVISEMLRSRKELVPIVDRYIAGSEIVNLKEFLAKAGIDATERDQLTRLAVAAKPSGRQKVILDKLGYNSWRKIGGSQ